jgi:divalent metal cation (Fe/Co/Zn/Cd) transporter
MVAAIMKVLHQVEATRSEGHPAVQVVIQIAMVRPTNHPFGEQRLEAFHRLLQTLVALKLIAVKLWLSGIRKGRQTHDSGQSLLV